ncbi:DNA primase [Gracilimonas mengyeensis]|uniref:DNA primase n=1 Tax=Gracilimonas mengyeensis TaxID=1302730 RepID=A0A521FLI8_9BACT|nr:DNA primase [Gracilimonas mengyeensis]SMO96934.1 DNA primase [Gracilimonas mengyeensis]
MISDDKKEEVRAAADIVEVVSDYVKLKKSGSGFVGLCPYHDEKTPSFNVTPRLGIFKCFGCGESGDVFKFVMDQEGVGFTEAVRQLAERYGVFIPEEDNEEPSETTQLREGIYHALKFAGVFFYRNLIENSEAEKARKYLEKRGYNREVYKKFGLGYAPSDGEALWKAAQNAGIDDEYLVEANLIKPSNRGSGFYDTFRGRLMFPIFNPTGKVIAFAGRVLGDEKTAKYINSAQTKVYNKSEVVYGVNFAKNEIRKNKEVILVEGYTDVITLNEHGIGNVVASSGTSLTVGQMKILHRYGERIVMIYDSDSAGQTAMKRGINIALAEGMEVELLELPEGQDPDSFVKQFGKESFDELKNEEAADFVDFLLLKAEEEGRMAKPTEKPKVITEVLEAIANIPDTIQRQVYVQYLHQQIQKFQKVKESDLFEQLERVLAEKRQEEQRSARREQARERAQQQEQPPVPEGPGDDDVPPLPGTSARPNRQASSTRKKKPHFEKELIRLMITYGRDMVEYICSFTNAKLFEDEELQQFYEDVTDRFKEEKEISIQVYSGKEEPFPRLVGDVLLEQHTASDRHEEKVGLKYEKDKNPYKTAKSAIRATQINFYKRKLNELADRIGSSSGDKRLKLMERQKDIKSKLTRRETADPDDLFPDPEKGLRKEDNDKVFVYKMKGEE